MSVPGRIALLAILVAALAAAPAGAADYCVAVDREGCEPKASLAAALDAADEDVALDRVFLGRDETAFASAFADVLGRPVEIIGSGAGQVDLLRDGGTVLELSDPMSRVEGVRIAMTGAGAAAALELAGTAADLRVEAPSAQGLAAQLAPGAMIAGAAVIGGIISRAGDVAGPAAAVTRARVASDGRPALLALAGPLRAESVDAAVTGSEPAVESRCDSGGNALLTARHVTIVGAPAVAADCDSDGRQARLELSNSVVVGVLQEIGTGSVVTRWSAHAPNDVVESEQRVEAADPGFVSSTDHRLRAESPLVDRGDPTPLAAGEGFWDGDGFARVVDGDGDGAVRRDVGAYERQPPPVLVPDGNVLVNGGAEATGAEVPRWTRSGTFAALPYGTVERSGGQEFAFPSAPAATALGGGSAFFTAGTDPAPSLTQRIDISESARAIDAGGASATLSGLLGGYGADSDAVRLEAIFRDPAGVEVSRATLPGPTPAERGNATNLLARSLVTPVPARTRAVDVVVSGARVGSDSYTDAYADNLALVLSVPGVPVEGPVDPTQPVVGGLKPFAGIRVLSARPSLTSRKTVRVSVACESATVGRCTGRLELRALLPRRTKVVRIARFGDFSLAPGRTAIVSMRLIRRYERPLRGRRSFRATVFATAFDGQSLQRRTTIPVRVRRTGVH